MTINAAPLTQLLSRWKAGDRGVENELIATVYPFLRGLAANHIRKSGERLTFGATDLANEAYIKLQQQQCLDWQSREHFFAISATVVRSVVIDYLRERNAHKRGSGKIFVALDGTHESELGELSGAVDWIAIDQALSKLCVLDPDTARVVEMKLFSDLNADQIASVCKSSTATVGRQWRFAKSWLANELEIASLDDVG
jgi:RNA polymerase sigma factor (TIGR02999 family)